jgi:orotate phosphoribosyltransferase
MILLEIKGALEMSEEDILGVLEETGALLTGHFELRSGLHSERFFQCANLLRFPDKAELLCSMLVDLVKKAGIEADAVISPAVGGILVGHEVARALGVMSIFAEKEAGQLVMRRFAIEAGRHYVVAEDVVTRGGRVQETIDLVEAGGGIVSAVAVLVDRSGGKAKFEYPMFSLIKMEPVVWKPEECPLCQAGSKAVHPGS